MNRTTVYVQLFPAAGPTDPARLLALGFEERGWAGPVTHADPGGPLGRLLGQTRGLLTRAPLGAEGERAASRQTTDQGPLLDLLERLGPQPQALTCLLPTPAVERPGDAQRVAALAQANLHSPCGNACGPTPGSRRGACSPPTPSHAWATAPSWGLPWPCCSPAPASPGW